MTFFGLLPALMALALAVAIGLAVRMSDRNVKAHIAAKLAASANFNAGQEPAVTSQEPAPAAPDRSVAGGQIADRREVGVRGTLEEAYRAVIASHQLPESAANLNDPLRRYTGLVTPFTSDIHHAPEGSEADPAVNLLGTASDSEFFEFAPPLISGGIFAEGEGAVEDLRGTAVPAEKPDQLDIGQAIEAKKAWGLGSLIMNKDMVQKARLRGQNWFGPLPATDDATKGGKDTDA